MRRRLLEFEKSERRGRAAFTELFARLKKLEAEVKKVADATKENDQLIRKLGGIYLQEACVQISKLNGAVNDILSKTYDGKWFNHVSRNNLIVFVAKYLTSDREPGKRHLGELDQACLITEGTRGTLRDKIAADLRVSVLGACHVEGEESEVA